jgi:hypothetical protein
VGEETRELSRLAPSGLCFDHLPGGGPTGIGS